MKNVHGIIYAYHAYPELGALGIHRTGASLPFCGRYRLIDFALSAMMHAGIKNVGVIMQRGYLSLMDHLGSGISWDLARHSGGLHMLPPYGLQDASKGTYEGCMEALGAVYSYLLYTLKEDYVFIARGDLCASLDIRRVVEQHLASGADITCVCAEGSLPYMHNRFIPDGRGFASELICHQTGGGRGLASLECCVLSRKKLIEMVEWSFEGSRLHFHADALMYMMHHGWRVGLYAHEGYARHIVSVLDYYQANMDMLDADKRSGLFPADRYVATRTRSSVSTYYSDTAHVVNCLVADGCIIEGSLENCIVFRGAKVRKGAELKNSIVMNDCVIGEDSRLECVIADKEVLVSDGVTLVGSERLPIAIPKASRI